MTRWNATATCWTGVALLWVLGCKHEPDVVAHISQIEDANGGRSGAGGSAGSAQDKDGGSAGSAKPPTSSDGASGRTDGSVDSGAEAAAGGSGGSGGSTGGTAAAMGGSDAGTVSPFGPGACGIPQLVLGVTGILENECVLSPDTDPGAAFFVVWNLQPVPAMGETEIPLCQRLRQPVYREDETGKLLLCVDYCMAARNWLESCGAPVPGG